MSFEEEFEALLRKHQLKYSDTCEITEDVIFNVYGFDGESSPYNVKEDTEEEETNDISDAN